jgi:hypothetical protein
MFSGQVTQPKWIVLIAIAALAVFVIACGTDDTRVVSNDNDNGGVGAQPTDGAGDTVVATPRTDNADPNDDITQGDPPPTDPGFQVVDVLAPIESVEILVLESSPEQYIVQVISGLPSGCASFSHTEVTRDGTDIKIDVYNTVPAPGELIACTEIYGLHDENVVLGSDFERDTEYTVLVNDYPASYFTTTGFPIHGDPPYSDPGFVVEPAPVEGIEIIMFGESSGGTTTYSANVLIGLSNGCKEALEPNVVRSSRTVFDVYPVVKVPTGDIACTDNYRIEAVEVYFGEVGEELISCTVYTVNAGEESVEFQAIAPNVRCANPDDATPTPEPPSSGGGIIADSQALELTLKAMGVDVEYGGANKAAERFGVIPSEMKVNGQQVLIYSFAPGTSAEKASESVSPDGRMIQNADGSIMSVMWIATPHFYLYGNAIILYIGDDAEMGVLLDSLGGQFAGGEFGGAGTGSGDDSEFTSRPATIEKVSIDSTRSIPAQHHVVVTIVLNSGCETFKEIDWNVKDREVHINVYTQVPSGPVMCTLAIAYHDESVNIGSDFESGFEYDVIVNGERQGSFMGG